MKVFNFFILQKDFAHTYWRNVGCEDCKDLHPTFRQYIYANNW